MADVLFPASIIGSMPRPAFVRELIADDSPLSDDEYRRMMGSAVHYIVAMQEAGAVAVEFVVEPRPVAGAEGGMNHGATGHEGMGHDMDAPATE